MADWKDVAAVVAPYAPTVGKFLGGLAPVPFGGMAGEWAGSLIAKHFGVQPTPAAVEAAVRTQLAENPEVAKAQLSAAEGEAEARWNALAEIEKAKAADRTAQATVINETIRAEKSDFKWHHWRHLIGYVVIMVIINVMAILTYVVILADTGRLNFAVAIMPSVAMILGFACGLLGYVAGDTSTYKENVLAGAPRESGVAAVVKKVTGR
jgi:hypothetical protein